MTTFVQPQPEKRRWSPRRLSLTTKMLLLTLSLGLLIWYTLDAVQKRALHATFMGDLSTQLRGEAEIDRRMFDQHIQGIANSTKLIASQHNFIQYLNSDEWPPEQGSMEEVVHHRVPPNWMPPSSVLRAFFRAREALLLDPQGHLKEMYHNGSKPGSLPDELKRPSLILRKLSHNQAYLTAIGGQPYVLAAQQIFDDANRHIGTLLLTSPLDSEFLRQSRMLQGSRSIMSLIDSDTKNIIASSDPDKLEPGVTLDAVKEQFMVIDKSFFDYGASDLELQFASLISTERAERLATTILQTNSQQRAILAVFLVLAFSLLTMWIAMRIRGLSNGVVDFATDFFGRRPEVANRGDELDILIEQFNHLAVEVVEARERSLKEAEERLTLTKRALMSEQQAKEMQLAGAITENVLDGIMVTDVEGIILNTNPAMSTLTGYSSEEMQGQPASIFNSQHHDKEFFNEMWHKLRIQGTWEGEIWNRRKDDTTFPTFARISALRDENGAITHYIAVYSDISEHKEREAHLAHLAFHDHLTRLPNRNLFYDRLDTALSNARRNASRLAVLFIDLDGFKEINDNLGHHAGDLLLQEVAVRLRSHLRESDTVSRYGGDEFAVLIQELKQSKDVTEVTDKLLDSLNTPFQLEGQTALISGSIGVALYPGSAATADELVRVADEAMYRAKQAGKNTVCTIESPLS